MKRKLIYLAIVALSGAILVYSCSKSTDSSYKPPVTNPPAVTPPVTTPVTAATATIEGSAFSPATINLKTGGTVTWTNKDGIAHTVTDNGGAFDSGNLSNNQTYQFTFSTAGTYTYHCNIHSMMKSATVVVTN